MTAAERMQRIDESLTAAERALKAPDPTERLVALITVPIMTKLRVDAARNRRKISGQLQLILERYYESRSWDA